MNLLKRLAKSFLTNFLILFSLTLISMLAMAADPSPLPSGLPVLDSVHLGLAGLSAGILSGVAILLELVFRMVKSPRPLSLAWGLVGLLRMAIAVLHQIEQILFDLAAIMDKVLPQRALLPAQPLEIKKVDPPSPKKEEG